MVALTKVVSDINILSWLTGSKRAYQLSKVVAFFLLFLFLQWRCLNSLKLYPLTWYCLWHLSPSGEITTWLLQITTTLLCTDLIGSWVSSRFIKRKCHSFLSCLLRVRVMDHKESRPVKNWCLWNVVLLKSFEGIMDREKDQRLGFSQDWKQTDLALWNSKEKVEFLWAH